MFDDTDLPKSVVDSPDAGFDAGSQPSATPPPVRFGRLALCVAAASALTLGVVGTIAYGVWFNHDQQAYAAAMTGAQQALGTAASGVVGPVLAKSTTAPRRATLVAAPRSGATAATGATGTQATARARVITGTQSVEAAPATSSTREDEEGGKQASWSGPVTRPSTPIARQSSVADATPAASGSSVSPGRRAATPSNASAQQLATGRPARDAHLAQQDRRSSSAVNPKHKSNLFARVSSFFRRVGYRQHGHRNQQDIYSHP